MNIALWIIAGLLAVSFLASGVLKLMWPRQKLITAGMAWAGDFGDTTVYAIGVLEILAAVGLILPAVLDVAPVFVPVAAVGLALLMAGALVTHLRRRETQPLAVILILFALAVFVAWGRFAS
jgi:uncharacterized membrane protein